VAQTVWGVLGRLVPGAQEAAAWRPREVAGAAAYLRVSDAESAPALAGGRANPATQELDEIDRLFLSGG